MDLLSWVGYFIVGSGVGSCAVLTAIAYCTRCKHEWELVDKTVFPSDVEVVMQNADKLKHVNMRERLKHGKVVLAFRCKRCLKLRVYSG